MKILILNRVKIIDQSTLSLSPFLLSALTPRAQSARVCTLALAAPLSLACCAAAARACRARCRPAAALPSAITTPLERARPPSLRRSPVRHPTMSALLSDAALLPRRLPARYPAIIILPSLRCCLAARPRHRAINVCARATATLAADALLPSRT